MAQRAPKLARGSRTAPLSPRGPRSYLASLPGMKKVRVRTTKMETTKGRRRITSIPASLSVINCFRTNNPPRISCERLKTKESDCLAYCDTPGNEKKKKRKKEKIEKATTMRMQNCAAQSIARSIF